MERINYNKIEMKFKEMKYLVSGGGMRLEKGSGWNPIQVSGVYIMGNGVLLGPLP